MNINPQFVFDQDNKPTGVFLPIAVWQQIQEQLGLAGTPSPQTNPWDIVADEPNEDDDVA